MRPICYDLFCGLGGAARGFIKAGYRVVGFDTEKDCAKEYPGEMVVADVRDLDGKRFQDAQGIWASPPCDQFSYMNLVRKVEIEPDMSCVDAAFRIRKESGIQTVIENVAGARRYFPEPPKTHRGAYYLWGDVPLIDWMQVPPKMGAAARALKNDGSLGPKRLRIWGARDRSEKSARRRAMVPIELSYPLALGMLAMEPVLQAVEPTGASAQAESKE
jgi:C-5 cytosine-specific DNA methylase